MNKIILITSEGCLGCEVMRNSINTAISKVKIAVDVEEKDITSLDKYFKRTFNVTDTPCMLLFKDNKFLFKKVGSVPAVVVIQWINVHFK